MGNISQSSRRSAIKQHSVYFQHEQKMDKMQEIKKAVDEWINDESGDLDESNEKLRSSINTLEEARFALATFRQHIDSDHQMYEDFVEAILSL